MTKYRNHDALVVLKSPQYEEHVRAMTAEELHGKAEIAEELATRDIELARMRDRIERLRGALKSASGRFFDLDELGAADDCLIWAGDMEPPIMGSNAELRAEPANLDEGPR